MEFGAKYALILFGVFAGLIEKSLKANMHALAISGDIARRQSMSSNMFAQQDYYAFEAEHVAENFLHLFHWIRRDRVRRGDKLLRGCKTLLLAYRTFIILGVIVSAYLMNHLALDAFTHNIYATVFGAVFIALFTSENLQVVLVLAASLFLEGLEEGKNVELFINVVYWVSIGALVVLVGVAGFDVCTVLHLRRMERDEKDPQVAALLRTVPRRGRPLDVSATLAVTDGDPVPKDKVSVGAFLVRDGDAHNVYWRALTDKGAARRVFWRDLNRADAELDMV